MTSRPLAGKRVVTTRERPGELDSALARLGADVVNVPLISIETPADGGAALARALERLAEFDWVVVTSRHGASRVAEALVDHPSVRTAAVGPATASVLAAGSGRAVDLVPPRHTGADLVVAMAGRSGRVLLAQADRADRALADGLTDSGFEVEVVTAYRTVLRHPGAAERDAALRADALVLASGSAAAAWVEAFGSAAPPVVAAIGPTTAAAAARCGLKVTDVAADQHIEGLVDAVLTALTTAS